MGAFYLRIMLFARTYFDIFSSRPIRYNFSCFKSVNTILSKIKIGFESKDFAFIVLSAVDSVITHDTEFSIVVVKGVVQ